MDVKFYVCESCGTVVPVLANAADTPSCCGQGMKELVANSTDASAEKHLPQVEISGHSVVVHVGQVAHPMSDEHFIEFICLVSDKGYQMAPLSSNTPAAKAEFSLVEGDVVRAVYEYCNLHGLWKTSL